ncbi:MAG: hypothetical protein QNL24_05125 [Akkermansiaceae bacterium]
MKTISPGPFSTRRYCLSARWSSHHKKDLTPLPHRRAMPPEMLVTDDERQAKLLKAFVDAAKEQWAKL